ncbi:MAG: hypothetical protein OXJ62_01950 [Spirochaetaceae bacterium]|nr:hypothetical protein [Spirochaetaceae bacterium]
MIRTDLGRRIELVAMDAHFHDITVALHRAVDADGGPAYDIHSYSTRDGARARLQAIATAMAEVAGMEAAPGAPLRVRFACRAAHEQATRRAFIEACKLDPGEPPAARPMEVYDKKTDATIRVVAEGGGLYRAAADADGAKVVRRVATVAGGLVKLAGMEPLPASIDRVRFACGRDHHELVAMLLKLALNARGVLREQELAAARGVLAAPSQQR